MVTLFVLGCVPALSFIFFFFGAARRIVPTECSAVRQTVDVLKEKAGGGGGNRDDKLSPKVNTIVFRTRNRNVQYSKYNCKMKTTA